MAFTVTPTSGTVPFVYTADFYARYGLDAGLYSLHFYVNMNEGSCLPDAVDAVSQPASALALLANGTYTQTTGGIPPGSCRTVSLVIRDAVGDIISQESVYIDNIE